LERLFVSYSGTDSQSIQEPVIEGPLARELDQYKGQWVAVFQDHVVAAGDSAVEVLESAQANHITDPLIFRVPTNPNRIGFY
jgi:hypothetical protein